MLLEESLHCSPRPTSCLPGNFPHPHTGLFRVSKLGGGPLLPQGDDSLLPPTPSVTELPDRLADFIISSPAQISLPSPSTSAEQWPSHQRASDWRGEAGL